MPPGSRQVPGVSAAKNKTSSITFRRPPQPAGRQVTLVTTLPKRMQTGPLKLACGTSRRSSSQGQSFGPGGTAGCCGSELPVQMNRAVAAGQRGLVLVDFVLRAAGENLFLAPVGYVPEGLAVDELNERLF